VAFHNFGPTLQHLCRADEVELPRLGPPVESWPPLRRVRRRPPISPLAPSSAVRSDPPKPRFPLSGLWRRGIDSAPPARGGTEGSGPTLLSHDSAGPRPDQRDCCPERVCLDSQASMMHEGYLTGGHDVDWLSNCRVVLPQRFVLSEPPRGPVHLRTGASSGRSTPGIGCSPAMAKAM
jgi:hypothetical protein